MKPVRPALGIVVCFLVSFAAVANDAPTTVARYANLSLGPSSPANGLTLTSGNMKMTLASGVAAPVKAGDETVGIFFSGDGRFEYTVSEGLEVPATRVSLRNIKASAKFNGTDAGGTVTGGFKEVLWIAPASVPALTGTSPQSLADSFASNRADYGKYQGTPLTHLLAARALNAPSSKFVRAEFRGEGEWIYEYDDFHTKTQGLHALFTYAFDDGSRRRERYSSTISASPIGRTRRDLTPVPFLLTKLDYVVHASEGKDVAITAKETFVPTASGAKAILLSLFDELYVDLKAPRHLKTKRVLGPDGKELSFVHRDDEILVTLPAPAVANKPIELQFELEGDLLHRPNNSSYWILDGPWHPIPDKPGHAFTVHGVVTVKGGFTPFAGGTTIVRKNEGGTATLETKIDIPVNFVAIIAGKFHVNEEKRDKMTIRTGAFAVKNNAGAKKIADLAFNMIKYYEYFLGPFPVDELNIVEINDYGWGQAPAGIVFITSEAFQPIMGEVNQIFSEGINERLAHEIAHQYWGVTVRWPSENEQWLSESFAEYSAALLLRKFQGESVYSRMVNRWRANAKDATKSAPIPLANRIFQTDDWPWERIYLLYNKGPLLLAAIHKQVGDEQFLTFMKSYQKTFRGKFGTTKDVEGLLGFLTKQDFKPFFEQYYWGTAMPETK